MPHYREAAYGDETVVLENSYLRLELHKRVTGWGWGELYVPGSDGKPDRFFAVLEHLAEAYVEGMPYPLRMEAKEYKLEETAEGQTLTFEVVPQEVEPPDKTYEGVPALKGMVTLSLLKAEALVNYKMVLEPQFMLGLLRIRGLWLRVGADSFETARHDAIFPGIDWLSEKDWSSGTDWFEHPQALRQAPHPHKVSFPVMAISYDGIGLGVSWTPDLAALSAGPRLRCPQPVFASPNFIDRRNHHLLGLMWPSARWGMKENALQAEPPIQVRKGLKLVLDGQISVVKGTSLDVVVDWVKRHGMPEPGQPRYDWQQVLDRFAELLNTKFWIEGEGWGFGGHGSPQVPHFVEHYAQHGAVKEVAEGLAAKLAWAKQQPQPAAWVSSVTELAYPLHMVNAPPDQLLVNADKILTLQTPDGDFPFDPLGRHKTMLSTWAAFWRPLGQPGDSALDLCTNAAAALVIAAKATGVKRFAEVARKTLDYAMRFERPEGGDWWETPLYSPNLFAAGNSAVAYYLAFKYFGDERYKQKAIHWIRCLLPFTHLWQPADVPMLYNTKPCLNSTCWYLSDWVSKHVQWEVLYTFAMSAMNGINWVEVDPEVDWKTYQRGITTAVLRWMIDHDDPSFMFRSEYGQPQVTAGEWDATFSDTFDPVDNTYGGGPILGWAGYTFIPDNILIMLGWA
jgi:hypothetical protein